MRPRYCCFYLHQSLRLGWARTEAAGHVQLVLPDGEAVRQQSANLLYAWDGAPAADDNAAQAQLEVQASRVEAQGPLLDTLYAAIPAGHPRPFPELAALAGLPAEAGWPHGLLFAALLLDKRRFRYSNGSFTARSPAEAAERGERELERRAEAAWLARVEDWHAHLQAGAWDDDSADARAFLAQLQSLLALERRSPHWALLARPLGLHNLHLLDVSTRIKDWLQTARAWPDWPAIWLQWAEVPGAFPQPLVQAAAALAAAPPRHAVQNPARRDHTRGEVYTVDSEATRDFDDALAILSEDAEGLTLALHIAEPDPALEAGHPLFEEAATRMASVYTLEGTFPMFPAALSAGRFSLLAGQERETVTFVVRLEEGAARLLEVERGLVRVTRNLDYGAGQALLDAEPARWGRLARLCATLADVRAAQGAVIMERREAVLDISDPEHIGLREVARNGPIHQVVEELAILYNREAGRYCRDQRLPAIYRVQPPPRRGGPSGSDGAEVHMAARFSTRGAGHAGLACDRYIQATSPIRRFADLAMQRQIAVHAAEGRVTFPERALLEQWAERADARLSTYDEVSRRIADDWKRRYLLQNRARIFAGMARRHPEAATSRVWLEPLHLLAQCVLPSGVHDGDAVRVRVESVDRDHQSVWVACVE